MGAIDPGPGPSVVDRWEELQSRAPNFGAYTAKRYLLGTPVLVLKKSLATCTDTGADGRALRDSGSDPNPCEYLQGIPMKQPGLVQNLEKHP